MVSEGVAAGISRRAACRGRLGAGAATLRHVTTRTGEPRRRLGVEMPGVTTESATGGDPAGLQPPPYSPA
jgi:hypothetical protein